MNNKNRVTFTPRSTLRNSFPVPFTMDNSIVTTTTTQSSTWKIPVNLARRRATVPTPNRPPIVIQPTILASSMTDNSLKQKDPENKFQSDDDKADDDFDAFVLRNFIPFSGKQNVISWLDKTEQKFRELRMVQRLRFNAIPLLIEGAAKQAFLTHGKEIRSFDDFYEFLLSQFDMSNSDTNQSDCNCRVVNSQLSNLPTPFQPRLTDNSTSTDTNLGDSTELTPQTPALCSTPIVDISATNTLGEAHDTTSVNSSNNLPAFDCDRTFTDLRKAIFADSIKNPKRFKGGNDVKELIKEVKHLPEVTKIPESTRLDLIPYSSRSDAFERFKAMDQAHSSFLTDQARKMFPSISYTRYNPLGYEASACSSL